MPVHFTPRASTFSGEPCGGVNIAVTNRATFDPVRVGLEIAVALRRVHAEEWKIDKLDLLLLHRDTLEAIRTGADADTVLMTSRDGLREFATRRAGHVLYE